MRIDWTSNESAILINPAYSTEQKMKFYRILNEGSAWPGHIWLATSGSTASKWVGLSKNALLASAAAVNAHLQSHASDRWATALPDFHVGGLGIWARSYLSGAAVFDFKHHHPGKWHAAAFYDYLQETKSTLTALVPSQLFDLVQLNKKAPTALRAVIIGGGRLEAELYNQAIDAGWKVLPSFGMTECSSQIATAALESSGQLKLLKHMQACLLDGKLAFKSASLLSVYASFDENKISFTDPKQDGWFVSEDRGEVIDDHLTVFGRADSLIKIGGENVDIARLESLLQSLRLREGISNAMTLVAIGDARLGHVIHAVIEGEQGDEIEKKIVMSFHNVVLPFERIRQVHWVKEIPRSPLSKILQKDLLKLIQK